MKRHDKTTSRIFFPRSTFIPVGHAFQNLHQTQLRKCKNAIIVSRGDSTNYDAMRKSQKSSPVCRLLIFFNLFLVVKLRKKHNFEKEKQYSTQNSLSRELFTGCRDHAILCVAIVAMTLICAKADDSSCDRGKYLSLCLGRITVPPSDWFIRHLYD